MSGKRPTIFLSAVEASGDEHAARLIVAMRRHLPEARLVGVGGPRMAAAGCEIIWDATHKASMLLGPVMRLGYYFRAIRRVKRYMLANRPDLHIPVDSPALNWHLAAGARAAGAKVLYYIAPQVWAWAPQRVRKLARLTDNVACILPFEQRYLRDRGVNAHYVGHPLFDDFPPRPEPMPDLAEAWSQGTWRVALLPGSRPGEIAGHTAALVAVADAIRRKWPRSRCAFAVRTEACEQAIRHHRSMRGRDDIDVVSGDTRGQIAGSHFAVAGSGTVTLEVAYYGVPMVVFYRAGRLSYGLLGRWLIKLPYLSLANILAGRRLVPEMMPWHGDARGLVATVLEVMNDLGCLFEMRQDLLELTAPLRVPPPGSASDNAARLAAAMLR